MQSGPAFSNTWGAARMIEAIMTDRDHDRIANFAAVRRPV
jgi:hypothetical protein